MQEGHSSQDLLGQPDHIFLCEGLVVIGNTLVEDFATGGAGRKAQEGKLRKQNKDKTRRKNCAWTATQRSLVWHTFSYDYSFQLVIINSPLKLYKHALPLSLNCNKFDNSEFQPIPLAELQ